MTESGVKTSGCGGIGLLALYAALGYFIYGGLDGAFAMILMSILVGFTVVLAFIPFCGVFVQWWVATTYVMPWIFDLTGTVPTWVTTVILVVDIIIGILVTVATTFFVAAHFAK